MKKARTIGISLAVIGVVLCAGAFFLSEDFTPYMGLRWNLKNMQVVLKDKVHDSFMDVAAFRERYPQYSDMDDQELALRLRTKYFSGMKEEEYRRIFLAPAPAERGAHGGGDPLMIRWDLKELKVTDILTRAIMTSDAIEFGLLKRTRKFVAFPFRWALLAALGLVAAGALVSLRGNNK